MLNLNGIRVLEMGTAVSIPMLCATLSNLGAEVIKIESSRKPDANRVRLPKNPALGAVAGLDFPLIHDLGPAKRSVLLNMKTDRGRDLFLDLIAQSDVFVQGYVSGWLERLGLSVDRLAEVNPRLVMVFGSGYGQTGPGRGQRAYATIMSALAGLESLVGYSDGEVAGMVATAFGDPNSAFFGVLATMAALRKRERTGRGMFVDLSQIEAIVALLGEVIVGQQTTDVVPGPKGNVDGIHAPHGVYPCRGQDRWIAISVRGDAEWEALRSCVDDPDVAHALDNCDLANSAGRIGAGTGLDALVSQWTRDADRDSLVVRLMAAGVAAVPVQSINEVEQHEFFRRRGLTQPVAHPQLGTLQVTTTPWVIDGARPPVRGSGPGLGADTESVLGELAGLSPDEVRALIADGVLI